MSKTAADLSEEELKQYDPWANLEKVHKPERKKEALNLAKKAAKLLRSDFGVDKVWIIGSLARDSQPYTQWSDIDLITEGLSSSDFWKAGARLDNMTDDFQIDLIAIQHATPSVREEVKQDGVEV